MEISEINWNISQIQAEIVVLKGLRASLEASIIDSEQCGELAVKDTQAKVAELKATLKTTKQVMARQLSAYQGLMNVKLALDLLITTYHKLLQGGGEPAGVWDAEHEYPYQDHQRQLRWVEPSLLEPQ